MAIFGKKKDKTIDLTARYMKQKERMENLRGNMKPSQTSTEGMQEQSSPGAGIGSGFGFLDNASSYSYGQSSTPQTYQGYPNSAQSEDPERKRKLAKRLMDITDKLEEISNQLYHLQQRVEVLEKKMNPGGLGF